MVTLAAVVATALLVALAALQVALAAGAPLGRLAWGGHHRVLPTRLRIGSAVSVLLYALFAWLVWRAAAIAARPGEEPAGVAIWALTVYFAVGVVANALSRSRPERAVMTPVAAVLAVCCLVVALG
ncbi:hypothetical protein ACI8AC_03400 [Geodermatophilus sp. SYSU D00758]